MKKSKKLKPSQKLFWLVKDPVKGRQKGERIEHLICEMLEMDTVCAENAGWVDRNIGLKGLSSLTDWERTQALEELFLCARCDEELLLCASCDALRPASKMEQDDALEGDYCSHCLDDILSAKETEDDLFRTYFRGYL